VAYLVVLGIGIWIGAVAGLKYGARRAFTRLGRAEHGERMRRSGFGS
jgi:hypothetical protein